jgi:hypothetical protein
MQCTDVKKLKIGDIFYRVVHYEVTSLSGGDVGTFSDTAGDHWISSDLVEKSAYTTNQFVSEKKVTRSEMAQKIETLGHAAFKVMFRKMVPPNDIADGLDGADLGTQAKRRKLVKTLTDGEERVMHCRLHRSEQFDAAMELGRYRVVDLEVLLQEEGADFKKALRMIDTRTLTELVVDNIRYYV